MKNTLIITEKPSVASDIATALGGFTKQKEYYESDSTYITWAIGHLITLAEPDDYDKKYKFWALSTLPIIPEEFTLKPIKGNKERLTVIKKLANKKEVTEIINACDAGREGELIFRYIYDYLELKKDFRRLWLQSMTPDAIRKGFKELKERDEVDNLALSAKARSQSDWLIGINATRAFTRRLGTLLSIGRVQTPTLSILVAREKIILDFKSIPYFELTASLEAKTGEYTGKWFIDVPRKVGEKKQSLADSDVLKELEKQHPGFAKSAWDSYLDVRHGDRLERVSSEDIAQKIIDEVKGKEGIVTKETHKNTKQSPPPLFNLNDLQREANQRFGLRASHTLKITQSLYDEKKLVTYPRTDSKFLPEDYVDIVPEILEKFDNTIYSAHTKPLLKDGITKSKKIFDDKKVSDHFAIIPTTKSPESVSLDEAQQKIYDLIVRRFISVFYPPALWKNIERVTEVEKHTFRTTAKVLLEPGFLKVHGRTKADKETLPEVKKGENVICLTADKEAKETKAPPRFNDATLLGAMEGAGKLLDDETVKEAMKGKGLGTPATRSSIIERLISVGYVDRVGRDLAPTGKGIQLYDVLTGFPLPELVSPEMTGEWEYSLTKVENGKLKVDTFMKRITDFTSDFVRRVKEGDAGSITNGDKEPIGVCPLCGGNITENFRAFGCSNYKPKKKGKKKKDDVEEVEEDEGCKFAIWKTIAGRYIDESMARELLEKKKIGPLTGLRGRTGRTFSAILNLTDEGKIEFEFVDKKEQEEPDVEINPEPLGICPVCKGEVNETKRAFECSGFKESCKLSVGRVILGKRIEREDVIELLKNGKTSLISGFTSRRGYPFSAYLVLKDDGKVGFEFEPRKGKTTKAKKGTTKSKTTKKKVTKKKSS
jgi:DNA topoisomerase III